MEEGKEACPRGDDPDSISGAQVDPWGRLLQKQAFAVQFVYAAMLYVAPWRNGSVLVFQTKNKFFTVKDSTHVSSLILYHI